MNRNYTKITRCPICNSKHLTVSEYYGQVWNDRVLRGGKLSKGKRHTYSNTEYIASLTCEDCYFQTNNDNEQFRISEEGDILIDDDYLEHLKKLKEK